MFPIGSKCLRINKSTSSRNTKANWELPQNRKQEILRNAMPTLRHKNRPAEQAAVRCCRRRLPIRRQALLRIRPAAEVLLRETGHRPYGDTSAGKRPARIRRPQHFMERRGSCGKPVELPACPAFYHGTAEGTVAGRTNPAHAGILPGAVCLQGHDCRFCHS